MADQNLKVTLSAVDKTRQAFASVRNGLGRIGRSVANVRTALIGLGATVALKQFATQIDNLAKASGRLGLTVNQIQSLQFAASQTGASAAELEKGLTRFSRNISEASTGIGTGVRAFEALGITLTDVDGNLKPTNELLNEVSDRLSFIKDPADKVRIAFDLFGRSGVNLVNTLQAGSGELNKLRDEFNSVTLQLTSQDAKAVEEANDLFDKLGRTFVSFGQKITTFILPPLARLAKFLTVGVVLGFANAIEASRDFLNFFIKGYNKIADLTPLDPIEKFGFGKELEQNLRNIAASFNKVEKEANTVRITIGATVDGFKKAKETLEQLKTTLNDTEKAFISVAKSATDRMTDSLMGLIQGTVKAKDAFRDMANSIISDLIRMAIRKYITDRIFGVITQGISSAFGAPVVASGVEGGAVVGARAIGGSVQRGRPYMVGERGAELFVPNRNGAIVPNDAMGGGASVVVNQTINLSTGVAQTVRTEVLGMLPQIAEAAKGAVYDARRRGGQFGSAFGA